MIQTVFFVQNHLLNFYSIVVITKVIFSQKNMFEIFVLKLSSLQTLFKLYIKLSWFTKNLIIMTEIRITLKTHY